MIPPDEDDITITPFKAISLPSRTKADEETAMPDWLQQLTDDVQREEYEEDSEDNETAFAAADQTSLEFPDWLTELADQDDRSTTVYGDEIASAQDLPDWLSTIADRLDTAVPEPTRSPEIPEWLSSKAEDASASSQSDQPLPDRLKPALESKSDNVNSTNIEEFNIPVIGAPPEDEVEKADYTDNSEQQRSMLSHTNQESAPSEFYSTDTPVTEPPEAAKSLHQTDANIELTPDWLSIPVSDIEVEDNQGDEEGTPDESVIPDWLSALGEDSFEVEHITTPKLSSQTVIPKEELPTWLSELDIQHGPAEDSTAVFTPESAEAIIAETKKPDTPTWLNDVSLPAETIAITPVAPAFVPSADEVDLHREEEILEQDAAAEALPDWLNELRLPAPGETNGDMTSSSGYTVPDGELLASATETFTPGTDDLVRAEVPEWVHALKPPAGSAWPSLTPSVDKDAIAAEELSPADVPDWVQALRPKPGELKEKLTGIILPPEPAEIEGPLTGLVGILPTTAVADMPANYEINLVKIPDNVTQQAQLWQHLLGQPRSTTRRVARREIQTDLSAKITRIITAAIFLLGSLAAIWMLPPSNLAVLSAIDNTPGPRMFVDSVDALSPGETVVVAVEYDWAHAEEMTAIANVVLDHLVDQEVNIMAVSTMPEGTALISDLLESKQLRNIFTGDTPYLSGSASGIVGFLNDPKTQSARMLIVLSSNYERIRWWIEQNQTTTGNIPLPVNAGLSASVGPLAAPYLSTQQTYGWIVGFQDSLSYQTLRGQQQIELAHLLDVLLVMHWSAIILLIIGFLYTLIFGKKRIA
jgi:hypothetical protein